MEFVCNKKYFCPTCFKKCKHVRQLFSNTLQLFLLNDNGIYIYGTGRYKSLVDRKCKYAIKYIKEVTKGFYRHICK